MKRLTLMVMSLALAAATLPAAAQTKPPLPPLQPPPGLPQVGDQPTPSGLPDVGAPHVTLQALRERIFRISKNNAVEIAPDRIRLTGPMQQEFTLIGEDGDFYLARMLPPEDPKSPLHAAWKMEQGRELRVAAKQQYYADRFLATRSPDVIPAFTKKIAFDQQDSGLPKGGHWQMSFDVADMNGDGLADLVLAPARLGVSHPSIYLQQADGTWKLWDKAQWPPLKFDYGTVRVADFDGDGNLDIALTCHFGDTYVLYGNGKGDFTRMQRLPKPNPTVTSRALTVADFNNDGRPDVATICEIDLDYATQKPQHSGLVVVYLNRPDGWKAVTEGFPTEIQGDWLSAALLLTSRKEGITDLFMRNVGKGTAFQSIASNQVPATGFVFANAVGALDRFKKRTDVVLCFEEYNPFKREDDPSQVCAIYRFHDAKGNVSLTPTPELLVKREIVYDNFKGVAVGDIDGDGRNDIALITSNGGVRVFLQFPDGRFYENLPEIKLPDTDPFDVHIVDLQHNGKGDVIVAGSPSGNKGGGGVWVFSPHPLGEGSAAASPRAAKRSGSSLDKPVPRS
jgi:hypothetical protein